MAARSTSSERQTVAVIGAGIVGVCAASWLRRDGHDVVLIEANAPGMGASYGNAGNFNASSVVPTSLPRMVRQVPGWLMNPTGPLAIRWTHLPLLAPWLVRFLRAGHPTRIRGQALALRSLVGAAMDSLMPLVAQANCAHLIRCGGTLTVYRSRDSFDRAWLAYRLRQEAGVEMELLEGAALREFEPSLSPDYGLALLVRENASTTNPHGLVTALVDSFVRAGGRLLKAEVRGFVVRNGAVSGLSTSDGEVAADKVVLAAGVQSKRLAARAGDRIPLQTERGYHLMIRDPEVVPRVALSDNEGKFAVTPMQHGLRIAGTVELASEQAAPDWRRARMLAEQARRLLPGLAAHYPEERVSMWMGHRPSTPDSLPVIGPARRVRGLFYAFGHGHTGMAGGPMTGRLVADLVAGRTPLVDLAPFSAGRFR